MPGPIDALGSATVALARGESCARVLEYLSKASSAFDGITDELEHSSLTVEDHEAIAPALAAVSVALARVDDALQGHRARR